MSLSVCFQTRFYWYYKHMKMNWQHVNGLVDFSIDSPAGRSHYDVVNNIKDGIGTIGHRQNKDTPQYLYTTLQLICDGAVAKEYRHIKTQKLSHKWHF